MMHPAKRTGALLRPTILMVVVALLLSACGEPAPTNSGTTGNSPTATSQAAVPATDATATTGSASSEPTPAQSSTKELQKIRFGIATKAISPIVINALLPEFLGYYAEEGLTVETIPLGSNAAVMTALGNGDIDFGVGVPSFQIPLVANGDPLPAINYYEYTYPFKWAVAVKPDSSYQKLEDLKGQTIGVANLGTTDYPIGQALFRLVGIDPETEVEWLAAGEGVTSGQALQNRDIAALVYFDTGFGQIEAAGIELRYLPLPEDLPEVGGLYISATPKMLEEHKDWAVGLARGVAKASVFIQNNPRAAAYGYIQMYPEASPNAATLSEQLDAVEIPIKKRMPLYSNDNVTKWGEINTAEWEDEAAFLGLEGKITDTSQFYTQELIDEVNQFDEEEIVKQAKEYKIPGE